MDQRLLATVVVATLGLALAGCGDDPFDELAQELGTTPEVTVAPEPATAPVETAPSESTATTTTAEDAVEPDPVPEGPPAIRFVVIDGTGGRGAFEQRELTTDLNGKVVAKLVNDDDAWHNLVIKPPNGKPVQIKKPVAPGSTLGFKIFLEPGKYRFYSSFKKDRSYGMNGVLTVE